jgi:hypothetical protein
MAFLVIKNKKWRSTITERNFCSVPGPQGQASTLGSHAEHTANLHNYFIFNDFQMFSSVTNFLPLFSSL